MKPKAILIDFDDTLFKLNVDWRRVKKDINRLLVREGQGKISGPLFHFLYELCKGDNHAYLCKQIQSMLDEREAEGLETGRELSLLAMVFQMIKSRKYTILVVTHNNRWLVKGFLEDATRQKIKVFGRTSLKDPPKNHAESVKGIKRYLDRVLPGAETIIIGNSWVDREMASRLNARFIDVKDLKLPGTQGELPDLAGQR